MNKIINLTPHPIHICDEKGNVKETFLSEGVARCTQATITKSVIGKIPITATTFGEVVDLPQPKPETYYIVSRLVLSACPERTDLLVPNELVRDADGNIVGCKSLAIS